MNTALLRAEGTRALHSRATVVVPVATAVVVAISVVGTAQGEIDKLSQGATSIEVTSRLLVGLAFAAVLFAAIAGSLSVVRDLRSRSFDVIAHVSPRRSRILLAKATVVGGIGLLVGATALGTAYGLAWFTLDRSDHQLALATPLWGYVLRHLFVIGLAAVWGVFVGALCRTTAVAIMANVVWMTMVESAILHFSPEVGRWLPGGAQAAIVDDPSLPERLSVLPGVVVLCCWLVALGALAVWTTDRRVK